MSVSIYVRRGIVGEGAGADPFSMFPVNSATLALIRATRLSMAIHVSNLTRSFRNGHLLSSPLVSPSSVF